MPEENEVAATFAEKATPTGATAEPPAKSKPYTPQEDLVGKHPDPSVYGFPAFNSGT